MASGEIGFTGKIAIIGINIAIGFSRVGINDKLFGNDICYESPTDCLNIGDRLRS